MQKRLCDSKTRDQPQLMNQAFSQSRKLLESSKLEDFKKGWGYKFRRYKFREVKILDLPKS